MKSVFKNTALLAWIEAYLSLRQQSVSIDSISSSPASVLSGIPQGSVLGPLFFLIFINDIVQDMPVKIKLFADDCLLYHVVRNRNDQALLNASLSKIELWCSEWQMKVNEKKTVSMTITRKRTPLPFQYSINGRCLSSVQSYKYLGVMITSDLRWNAHITYIQNKAMRKLGYLKRSLRQSTEEIKLLAYKTFIRPILEYASVVWDPFTEANISKLESVQRKSVRFIFNSYSWRTSPTLLLQKANLESLKIRRHRNRLKYMYLIYHDNLRIKKDLYIEQVIRRATRGNHSKKVKEFACKTDCFSNSFFPRTIREWNRLSASIVEKPTVQSFLSVL